MLSNSCFGPSVWQTVPGSINCGCEWQYNKPADGETQKTYEASLMCMTCVICLIITIKKCWICTFCSGTSSPPSLGVGDFTSVQSMNFSLNKIVSLCSVSLPNIAQSGRPWPFLWAGTQRDQTSTGQFKMIYLKTKKQQYRVRILYIYKWVSSNMKRLELANLGMSALQPPGSSGLMSQQV